MHDINVVASQIQYIAANAKKNTTKSKDFLWITRRLM